MVCTVFIILGWKILAGGSWNVELDQIYLIDWIADCIVRHALCALSVFFRDRKSC